MVHIRQMLEKLLKRERAEVETRLSRQVEEAGAQQDLLRAYIMKSCLAMYFFTFNTNNNVLIILS